ncbi:MAG: hypothetical protein ACLPT4_07300 [Verrucomicrobiia bacterium]
MQAIKNNVQVQKLKTWQRWGLIALGAVIGGVAVYGMLRWLDRHARRQRPPTSGAVTDSPQR